MSASRGLAEAIRTELVRSGVRLPVVADTGQDGPTSPTTAARYTTSAWLVDYRASTNTLPASSDPAWVEYSAGAATQDVTTGVLTMTAAATTDSLFNFVTLAGLDAAKGSLLESKVCVTTDSCDANAGACLAVFDGSRVSVLWLRADGLNVDGCADVPVTLSDEAHRVALVVRGDEVRAYVDGELLQTGAPAGATALEGVAFGTWVDTTP